MTTSGSTTRSPKTRTKECRGYAPCEASADGPRCPAPPRHRPSSAPLLHAASPPALLAAGPPRRRSSTPPRHRPSSAPLLHAASPPALLGAAPPRRLAAGPPRRRPSSAPLLHAARFSGVAMGALLSKESASAASPRSAEPAGL